MPTHEFAYQGLEREAVGFNEFRRFPRLDSPIALAVLCEAKRLTADELALHTQRDVIQAKRTLEGLLEAA